MKDNKKLPLKFYFLYICSTLLPSFSYGVDRITQNNSISGDQTIISQPDGNFELGIFSPSGESPNFYIGIWYKKVSLQTVVWVANRETPILNKHSFELKILNGNLILTNGSNSPSIWSTKLNPISSKSVQAVLLDSGNLVLMDGTDKPPIWQSFDHPTNTWLSGGKLSFDKKSNKPQKLTSWKNLDDPAPGLFSIELKAKTKEYVIMWNNTQQYWTSGPWNSEDQIFSLVPEMRLNYIYNFSYVDDENESYFTYSVRDRSLISRFVMDTSGQVRQLTWLENSKEWNLFWTNPKQQCQVYAYCGAYGSCNQNMPYCDCLKGFKPMSQDDWGLNDYSSGCVRKTRLQCEKSGSGEKEDGFYEYPNSVLPQNEHTLSGISIEECESACLKNCSCNAYAYDSSNGCSVWFEDLLNFQQVSDGDSSGKTLYLRLAASEFPNKSDKKLVIGVVGSVIAISVLLGLGFWVFRKIKRRATSSTKTVEGSLISFSYKDLQTATKNFSNKLGEGGFGSVFKGTLPDSSVIAVKKLESFSQGEKQFRSEVSTIGTIQHVNLVHLRGFCSEGTKKLLVYDYMPNGSLDTHLFHDDISKHLDWNKRYQIALGTARGLCYLHEKCRDCIIHCDIKPENILLDADFCPKVADFGLAKLVGRDFSRVLTTMRGTRGYLAPEWISGVPITVKADVFSFGMMLFELISGHRNTEQSPDGKLKFFPTWAASKVAKATEILSVLDPRLEGNGDEQEVMKLCKIACWCIQDNETQRPSMGQVVQILEGVLDLNMPPMPRSLQVFVDGQESIQFYTESSSSQSSQTHIYSNSSFTTKTSSSDLSNKSLG
ncbi:G-type lectin S-receptor-like serine/threonine-protein kinase At2g19130 [Amaranthus tricolor]|uniref:G-type lectin S-receptor-like serine/threonine-protein kinase At2g19130 n=1 Tax=Amaranthus tricolor TaxID=29722 RepID=UPI002583D827|nr:G-type lectin S-receptor-like serine/threonine-protein kinase At2g19130 [Amaranthus tricolor]